jgi:hypothetical protein
MEELEHENDQLQTRLDKEREWHAKEIQKLKQKGQHDNTNGEVAALKVYHKVVVGDLTTRLESMFKDVVSIMEDPRVKEVDKKLSRLGREIKKAEGANRIVMELQKENEMLHEDLENSNIMIKGYKAMETEFKKLKGKIADVHKQSEAENKRFEVAVVSLQHENRQLAVTISEQSSEILRLKEVILHLGDIRDHDE